MAATAIPMSLHAASPPKDGLCEQLKLFEAAPLSTGGDAKPMRRFVEFQWTGNWLVGDPWGCVHTPDAMAKSFCAYLVGHTNQEFPNDLPIRVLRCHGYVFPGRGRAWSEWTSYIELAADDERSTDMDVHIIPGTVAAAVRISAVPWSWKASNDDKAPPALDRTPPINVGAK
jgi:hypothetical protein